MADKQKPALGAGDVVIIIDGEEQTMRPTLRAATEISRMTGGISGAIQRCASFDVDVIVRIVTLGLNLTPNGAKALPEKLYRTGYSEITPTCIRFLGILLNGGRPPNEEDTDEGQNPPTNV